MHQLVEDKINELRDLCASLRIKRMYAFGSVVNQNFRKESDIDFLISFIDSLSIEEYTNNYFTLHYELQSLFNRKIDLLTERSLSNPYFIESINESKQLIYEA